MWVSEWPGVYEDLFTEGVVEGFPIVGSWTRVHFLARLLPAVGERILMLLGLRAPEWLVLCSTSVGTRIALAALVGYLRQGPYTIMFSSPQWMQAVEDYVLTGYTLEEVETEEALVSDCGQPVFPLVVWAPGVGIHFLWRLLTQHGYLILANLGARVREWSSLRAAARGSRDSFVLALIMWLEATGPRYLADGTVTFQAASEFMRTGDRWFPFDEGEDEGIDDRPLRARRAPERAVRQVFLEDSSSSSEDSESSTRSPSSVSSAEVLVVDLELPSEELRRRTLSARSGLAVLRYRASEGYLVVYYGDDQFEVPLPGWTFEEIQVIVQGLETGTGQTGSRLNPKEGRTKPGCSCRAVNVVEYSSRVESRVCWVS